MKPSDLKNSQFSKLAIWLIAKLPKCKMRSDAIRFFLNRLVRVRTIKGWVWVKGVKFGDN